jgi:hypothetical protein
VLISPRAAEATRAIPMGFVRMRWTQRTGSRAAVRPFFAMSAAVCLLAGVAGGCADRSADFDRGQGRPGGPVENSLRDGRSSSDQLYDTYGRRAQERVGY